MAKIGSLTADLKLQSAAFIRDLGKAATAMSTETAKMRRAMQETERRSRQMQREFDRAFRKVSQFAGAFGVGLGAGALVAFGKRAIETVGNLGEMADAIGLSTEQLQVYQAIAIETNVSQEQLSQGLARYNRVIGQAAEGQETAINAFRRLGVGILDAGGKVRASSEILQDVARAIVGIEDPTLRALAVSELFGDRAGAKLIPMLREIAKGYDINATKAREMGLVIEDEVIARFDRLADAGERAAKRGLVAVADGLDAIIEQARERMTMFEAIAAVISGTAFQPPAPPPAPPRFTGLGGGQDFDDPGAGLTFLPQSEQDKTAHAAFLKSTREAIEQAAKAETAALERQANARKQFIDKVETANLRAFDFNIQLIERERDAQLAKLETLGFAEEQAAAARVLINQTAAAEIITVQQREAEESARRLQEQTRKTTEFVRELGLTFSSAFEDAVISGGKLRDVLGALAKDIQRIFLRKLVTEPIFNAIAKTISGSLFGGGGGGTLTTPSATLHSGWSGAGKPQLTRQVPIAAFATAPRLHSGLRADEFPAILQAGETVTPKGGGGDAGPTVFIDARGADREGMRRLETAIARLNGSIERRSVAAVVDAQRRGGSRMRQAFP